MFKNIYLKNLLNIKMFTKKNILVVDDSSMVLCLLPAFLKTMTNKYIIDAHTSFQNLLDIEKIKKSNYSIMILDYEVSYMNGYEYSTFLNENNIDIPIIFITAHHDKKISDMLLNSNKNVSCVLLKPFTQEQLLNEIKRNIK